MRYGALLAVLLVSSLAFAACLPTSKVSTLTQQNPKGAQKGGSMHELQRPQGKTEWPELVGRDADEAKTVIQQYDFHVVLVPLGSVMTMDFRQNRVRVMHDTDNKVVKPPRIG